MAFNLRNGSQTEDPRLARLTQFDGRSRAYATRNLLQGKKPCSRVWKCQTWLDQGVEGSCVGFSLAHELISEPCAVQDIDGSFAREKVYWEAQKIDEFGGGSYPGATPRMEGTSVLAGLKVLKKMGYIPEYRWAFGLDDLILAVGHLGPAVLGLAWYEGMANTAPGGYIHATGKVVGGHAILCQGVNLRKRAFILHNSWGRNWGLHGNAYLSFEEMGRLLHERGEAAIPLRRADPK